MNVEYDDKRWPTKTAKFKVFKDEGVTVVMTEGLSHPFDPSEGPPEGLGCEFFMESPDEDSKEWMVSLLRELVERVFQDPALPQFAQELPALPVEVKQVGIKYPEGFRHIREGTLTLFVGMSHKRGMNVAHKRGMNVAHKRGMNVAHKRGVKFTNKEGKEVPLLNVRLLTKSDVLLLKLGGDQRIRQIYTKLRKSGNHTQSSLKV